MQNLLLWGYYWAIAQSNRSHPSYLEQGRRCCLSWLGLETSSHGKVGRETSQHRVEVTGSGLVHLTIGGAEPQVLSMTTRLRFTHAKDVPCCRTIPEF